MFATLRRLLAALCVLTIGVTAAAVSPVLSQSSRQTQGQAQPPKKATTTPVLRNVQPRKATAPATKSAPKVVFRPVVRTPTAPPKTAITKPATTNKTVQMPPKVVPKIVDKKVAAPIVPTKPSVDPKKTPAVLVPKVTDKKIVLPTTPSKTPPTGGSIQVPGKLTTPLPPGKLAVPPGAGTPIGKTVLPTKALPLPALKSAPSVVKFLPAAKTWQKPLPKAAAGLNLTLFKPIAPGLKYVPIPKAPPNFKKWIGPGFGYVPPTLAWHPWKGKKVFPYFFVGAAIGAAAYVTHTNVWVPPPPSCYAGGSTVYYYPGTRRCFDFSTASDDDPFECHGRVFRWQPKRYRTVETLLAETASTAEPAEGWVDKAPERRARIDASLKRAAEREQTIAKVPLEQLDCSACLAALGPIEGEGGQATVSLVNNCDHDVTVSGGLSKQEATEDTPPVCEFVGDIPKGAEVAGCTRAVADFENAQIFLNAVTPVAGTTTPAPACRIPDVRAEAPSQQ